MNTLLLSNVVHPQALFAQDKPDEVLTETTYGRLRGSRIRGVNMFKGIPYAGSVSGEHRFRTPAPLQPWAGVRDASSLGAPSIQVPNRSILVYDPEPAEDCLFLNVWTPANDNRKRPVMFYCHGGGFSTGSAGSVPQDGANLARLYDVVVVQTNHRLGLLGYLYLDELGGDDYSGSGNNGMTDIVLGLEWVRDNISHFGGDPDNVMIWGESGGGAKVSSLYAMPSASALFHKASIESGPGIVMNTLDDAVRTTDMVLRELGIARQDWRRILDLPARSLLELQLKLEASGSGALGAGFKGIGINGPGVFGPVVDGHILPQHPFEPEAPAFSKDKPLLTGWNEDEIVFFLMFGGYTSVLMLDDQGLQQQVTTRFGDDATDIIHAYRQSRPKATPGDLYIGIYSDYLMGLGSIRLAERKLAQGGAPVYLYNFGYISETLIPGTNHPMVTPHAMDISFKFSNVPEEADPANPGMPGMRPERLLAAKNFSDLWTTFARTGKPGAQGQPEWEAYNLESRPTYRIAETCSLLHNPHQGELAMWQALENA